MIIRFLLTASLLYPTTLAMVIVLDTLVGDAEFLQHFLTVSRKETVIIVFTDWARAAPYCLVLAALYLLAAHRFGQKTAALTCIALACLSLIAAMIPPYIPTLIPCALFATPILAAIGHHLTRKDHE